METQLPTFLYIGENKPVTNYAELIPNEKLHFNLIYKEDDNELYDLQQSYDIDLYISEAETRQKVANLYNEPLSTRKKWIEVSKTDVNKNAIMYSSYIRTILTGHNKTDLISFFTIIHNNTSSILKTYHTLRSQTYDNWEWIILDVVQDENSKSVLQTIEQADLRIKRYKILNLDTKNIGNLKSIIAGLCTGEFIADLEQGSLLVSTACEHISRSSKIYPEAGFFYSDRVVASSNLTDLATEEEWAYGYGSYREDTVDIFGPRLFKVLTSPEVNSKTIRGAFNNFIGLKVWKRDVYFSARQFNRNLTIACDYDLIVKTFLTTRFLHIQHPCYIQIPEESSNMYVDQLEYINQISIIRNYYETVISQRFLQLGIEDWWSPIYGFNTENEYGEKSIANFIYT